MKVNQSITMLEESNYMIVSACIVTSWGYKDYRYILGIGWRYYNDDLGYINLGNEDGKTWAEVLADNQQDTEKIIINVPLQWFLDHCVPPQYIPEYETQET